MYPTPRTLTQLFALANVARVAGPRMGEGAIRARGYGLVVLRQLEAPVMMGAKVANLPGYLDVEGGLARALTLTGGWLQVSDLWDERFGTGLVVVGPHGGHGLFRLYAGPSGLALGGSGSLEEMAAGQKVADALDEAWRDVPLADPPVGRLPSSGAWDRVEQELRGDPVDPVGELARLIDARRALDPEVAEKHFATYLARAEPRWVPAVETLKRALDEVGDGYALPGVLDRIGGELACPPTIELQQRLGGREATHGLWNRVREVQDRRYAAHPLR